MAELGNNILREMRESLDKIQYQEKTKTDIKDIISDWEPEKICNEALIIKGADRGSVNAYSFPETVKELFAYIVHDERRLERHIHKEGHYKLKVEIFREKLKKEGFDPQEIVEKACENRNDLEQDVKEELQRISIDLPDEGESKWNFD